MRTQLTVDGAVTTLEHDPGTSLVSALRAAGFIGPKRGCESGDCGCCTVWVDGKALQSCLLPAYRAAGATVVTIAGLADTTEVSTVSARTPQLHRAQSAFLDAEGYQCGYCTAGMIMTLAAVERPGDAATALRGNICRCTGWSAILRAERALTAAVPDTAAAAKRTALRIDQGWVGESVPNRHGIDLVTGTPSYTADFPEAELLHIAALRSPHAHARVLRVDDSAARAIDGVVAVYWHEHVQRIPYTTACHPPEPRDPHDTYLLDDVMRFVGQRVAIVVATSKAIARRAAAAVQVEYRVLPSVHDPESALEPGAPCVHPERDSFQIADPQRNLIGTLEHTRGSIETGLAAAAVTAELTLHTPRQQHTHLEPHVATAWIAADGILTIRASTQVPYLARRTLARVLERPIDSIRVFKPRVGGGFGNKQEVTVEDLCAFAALQLGKPVQWEFDRHEEFTAGNVRHPMNLTVRGGADAGGKLTALELEFTADAGAYGNHSLDVLHCGIFEAISVYNCPNKHSLGRSVYTNNVPSGAFRGYGASQTTYAIESLMDELARKLDLDPLEFRRRNLVRPGDALYVGKRQDRDRQIGSYQVDQCIDHVQAAFTDAGELPQHDTDWYRGRGSSVAAIASGLAKIQVSGARLRIEPDGVVLGTSTADIGTASDTTLAQIAANALELPFDAIRIEAGDTAAGPEDSGAWASATAYIAGKAVELAARELGARIAAAGGWSGSWPELLQRATEREVSLEVEVSDFAHDRVSLSFAVIGTQVRVHRRTGCVVLERMVQAIDAGTLLNPRVALGQAEGGSVQSVGMALSEELLIDAVGRVANPTFRDYRVPAVADLPPLETRFFQSPDPDGPFGAKAIGELTTNAVPAAIANAVRDAIGHRIGRLPLTAERVWHTLQAKTGQ